MVIGSVEGFVILSRDSILHGEDNGEESRDYCLCLSVCQTLITGVVAVRGTVEPVS